MKQEHVGIFFDRDGTITSEIDFVRRPEELELLPESARAIREANESGIKVFIITNQSGIARGFLTERQLSAVHARMNKMLRIHRARVDAIYYCPHHPDYGTPPYNVRCNCRKPGTGMLTRAEKEFGVNLKRSFVVGDRCVDVKAGHSAGCTPFLVMTGYGPVERRDCVRSVGAARVAENAYDAWRQIKHIVDRRAIPSKSVSRSR